VAAPGAVQVGFVNGDVVINPSRTELRGSLLNLIVTASEHNKVGMLNLSLSV
jgi:polyribonucleotide nucleotidyltransferase